MEEILVMKIEDLNRVTKTRNKRQMRSVEFSINRDTGERPVLRYYIRGRVG